MNKGGGSGHYRAPPLLLPCQHNSSQINQHFLPPFLSESLWRFAEWIKGQLRLGVLLLLLYRELIPAFYNTVLPQYAVLDSLVALSGPAVEMMMA